MFDITQNFPQLATLLHSPFLHNSLWQECISNTIFAFIAGFGFACALNPLKRTLILSTVFAAIGYNVRFLLMETSFFGFAGASFCASLCIGLLATIIAKKLTSPIEVVVFPALLPMFPGSYGYKSIISLLLFIQQNDDKGRLEYLLAFFDHFMIMVSVSLALVAGVLIVLSIFYEQSFMMTRGFKRLSLKDW